jgi:hypothetical protein
MSDSVKTRIATLAAPYGREIRLDDVAYESGMNLLRVTIREGGRYTMLELDRVTARAFADEMRKWAETSRG